MERDIYREIERQIEAEVGGMEREIYIERLRER